jgi:hypothetical protein
MFIGPIMTFGTIRDSRTPENLTPDSGVGVGVDIFLGVGSRSGLPQMLSIHNGLSMATTVERSLFESNYEEDSLKKEPLLYLHVVIPASNKV